MPWARIIRASVFSFLLCLFLCTRVVVGFHPFRARLVSREPISPVDNVVRIVVEPGRTSGDLVPPFAIIARVSNGAGARQQFTIRVDEREACNRSVGTNREERLDCAWRGDWSPGTRHTIDVIGAGVWNLRYLELATHHGATRAFDLIVAPAGSDNYERPGLVAVTVVFSLLVAIFLFPEYPLRRGVRWIHRSVCVVVSCLLVLSVASPFVSPYTVLLSRMAFFWVVCALATPRLCPLVYYAWSNQRESTWRPRTRCVIYALVVLALYGAVVRYRLQNEFDGNYSGFLQISKKLFDANPMLSGNTELRQSLILNDHGGYDGQFMYFEVFDPFLYQYRDHVATYSAFIDATPYRFGRIGFSLLTRVFALGRWQVYPLTMSWLILGALCLSSVCLGLLALRVGANPAWGLAIILIPGFWQSLQASLPEPIAAAFLIGGYLCLVRHQAAAAGVLFAISLLVRETGAIFVACVVVGTFIVGRRREGITVAAMSLAPVLAWRAYLGWALYSDWGMQAILFSGNNVGTPLAGIVMLWTAIGRGNYFPGLWELTRAGISYPIVLIIGFGIALAFAIRRPTAVGIAAVIYGLMALSLTYSSVWVHVGNAQRTTYELFVAVALISLVNKEQPRALRAGVFAFWMVTAAYTFIWTFDAQSIRDAITPYGGVVHRVHSASIVDVSRSSSAAAASNQPPRRDDARRMPAETERESRESLAGRRSPPPQ